MVDFSAEMTPTLFGSQLDALGSFNLGRTGAVTVPASVRGAEIIHARADFNILGDGTDETAKLQALFAALRNGDTVIGVDGRVRYSQKLLLGNGSDTVRSTVNSINFVLPHGCHEVAFINPLSGLPKSGFILEWWGAAGGTMMEWAGPIDGIGIMGALQLDGRDTAAIGLAGYSFSHCQADALSVHNCTDRNIKFTTRSAVLVAGDANGITSADNFFPLVSSFSANNPNAIALDLDGYKAAGGQDVTGSTFGTVRLGYHANGGHGLRLGYTDFDDIDICICIGYNGPLANGGSPLLLANSDIPFSAPTTTRIGMFAANLGTITGATNGDVIIDVLSTDDAGTIPDGVTGLNVRYVHSADPAKLGQGRGLFQRPLVSTLADGDGYYGRDEAGVHDLSLTRRGNAAHIAAYADVEFEAGATGGPTATKQAVLSTARLTMGVPVNLPTYTFATLPVSPSSGDTAVISDCNTTTYNAGAAGGGANVVKVSYLGGSWKVG